ncbi:SRPBCC family protein [Dietzia sp. B32]|uniref:SRPBCC family protein n=1 Tax=Dietzia sp. B32 TaxID=2915130 RepID=UPI0021ADDA67|nr:SRPBCC family protein [Dietzia sp. B32]UVE96680.1 SRPBCC domain-containing protein [Dietzia sp. B32]
MPVTSVDRDLDRLTLTITAEFPVPVRRLWDAYVDPRQLEKFWGPPTWPATFTRHDVFPGGRSDYYMTGPDGTRAGGYWEFLSVDEGRSFEVLDGFSHDDGRPNTDLPTTRAVFTFGETATGSRLETTTHFNSVDELEKLIEMGIEEGTREAMGQIEAVVTDDATFAADTGTQSRFLDDRTVRFSRILRGTPQQVWDAHHDPELLDRWFHGPDGWALVDCRVASAPGETTRFEWAPDDGVEGEAFALTGELVSTDPPHREVFTETMEGAGAPPTLNEQTLTAVEGGTLMTLVITYDSAELRDMILGTGMVDGMETGYRRLESEVLTRT